MSQVKQSYDYVFDYVFIYVIMYFACQTQSTLCHIASSFGETLVYQMKESWETLICYVSKLQQVDLGSFLH